MRNREDEQLPEDAKLDALLATAHWTDLSFAAQSRLRDRIVAQQPRTRRWISTALIGSAVAAGVALVVGLTALLMRPPSKPVAISSPLLPPAPDTTPLIVSRPANKYEQLVMASAIRRREAQRPTPPPWPDVLNARIDELTQQLVSGEIDLATAGKQITQKSGVEPVRAALLQRIATAKIDRRIPLMQLYGQLATVRELPVLLRLADEPALRAAALNPILRLSDGSQLSRLPARYADEPSRVLIYREMIARNNPRLTDAVVSAVLDPKTQPTAVAALRGAPNPPVQAIVEHLDASRVSDRMSAARALGALCHSGGTMTLLQAMVDRDVHRREALMALLSCPDPTARRYLDDARRRRPEIGAELSALRTEVSSAL